MLTVASLSNCFGIVSDCSCGDTTSTYTRESCNLYYPLTISLERIANTEITVITLELNSAKAAVLQTIALPS